MLENIPEIKVCPAIANDKIGLIYKDNSGSFYEGWLHNSKGNDSSNKEFLLEEEEYKNFSMILVNDADTRDKVASWFNETEEETELLKVIKELKRELEDLKERVEDLE